MDQQPAALLQRLDEWVVGLAGDTRPAEQFFAEHEALRAEVSRLGEHLEQLETLPVEVPDELFMAAANLYQVLDILWDQASGEEIDPAEPADLLIQTRYLLEQTLPLVENAVEELSQDSSGVDI